MSDASVVDSVIWIDSNVTSTAALLCSVLSKRISCGGRIINSNEFGCVDWDRERPGQFASE